MPPIASLPRSIAIALGFMILAWCPLQTSLGDGPGDNVAATVRSIPPVGLELTDSLRERLAGQAAQIRAAAERLTAANAAERAEVLVFARAIELALEYSTFYSEAEIKHVDALTQTALRRAESLAAAEPTPKTPEANSLSDNRRIADQPTNDQQAQPPIWLQRELEQPAVDQPEEPPTGSRLIVGGFESKIDGSVQPYGLVVPASFEPGNAKPMRLDVWLHGRGEKSGEVQFLHQRSRQVGEIAPADTIVLHPYGRYCNAFKFAGEIDVLEAIEHVKTLFPIDAQRVNIRGFSMGGAGCWQLAVHYPGSWLAATPGAGFCETREFLKEFQQEVFVPTDYQQALLHWYDCPDWGNNLRHLPTIAYSGELDKQKQAADVMEQSLRSRGIELVHIIGPQTEHKLHPDSKQKIERRLAALSESRPDGAPRVVDFTTYTLRYPQSHWVRLEGLEEHWKESRVQATIDSSGVVRVSTTNVSRLHLGPLGAHGINKLSSVVIDQQKVSLPEPSPPNPTLNRQTSIGDTDVRLVKTDGAWAISPADSPRTALRKRPGLQGPIDDAFLSPFIFVNPNDVQEPSPVDRWVTAECKHAMTEWRRHFRGDVHVKSALNISPADKASKNLILFGTPASNPLIAEVLASMPIAWTKTNLQVGQKEYSLDTSALLAIYPSPFAADRYVVINSGFTFREYAYLNNARQIAMLPDWAVLDISGGATTQMPGKVLEAGFFNEEWQLRNRSAADR